MILTLTATQVSENVNCPKKLVMRSVLKINIKPSETSFRGNAIRLSMGGLRESTGNFHISSCTIREGNTAELYAGTPEAIQRVENRGHSFEISSDEAAIIFKSRKADNETPWDIIQIVNLNQ